MNKPKQSSIFRKLKLKIILTNVLISAAVLLAAFSTIYFIVSSNIGSRPFIHSSNSPQEAQETQELDDNTKKYFEQRIHDDRKASLEVLLTSLIITGISIEICIVVLSIFLAELSVRPVREAYEAQKAFIANASHEIKTPLAVIQANLEAADIKGNHWLDNVAKKTEDLANLNQQLLAIARMDAAPEIERPETIDLVQTIRETADFYLPRAAEKGTTLKVTVAKSLEKPKVDLACADFVQLLNILIDNAVKYSAKKIQISVEDNRVIIKNDGATIDKSDIDHIFDRFYQTDKTKSGVGLGLAIAKQIADRHKWKLKADSSAKNTWFTLEF